MPLSNRVETVSSAADKRTQKSLQCRHGSWFTLRVARVARQVQNHRTTDGRDFHGAGVPRQDFSQGIRRDTVRER